MTKGQKDEIDFLSKRYYGIMGIFEPTKQEIEEYLNWTTKGIKPNRKTSGRAETKNRLFVHKRSLDIQIKMWRGDLIGKRSEGVPLLYAFELLEEEEGTPSLDCKYFRKLLKTTINSLPTPYNKMQLVWFNMANKTKI
jgi:hypothetical protein